MAATQPPAIARFVALSFAAFACSAPPPAAAPAPADAAADAPGPDVAVDAAPDVALPDGISPGCSIMNCDDNNSCTFDDCLLGTCMHAPVDWDTPCIAANPCFVDGVCHGGNCVSSGKPVVCDKGKDCQTGACDPAQGCVYTPVPAGAACDDLNGCTVGDSCDATGTCVPGALCPSGGSCSGGVCTPCGLPDNPLPGEAGAACFNDADCDSGLCVDTADGKVCTKPCTDCCPAGWACVDVTPLGGSIYACMPRFVHACDPCSADSQCNFSGSSGDLCVSYGAAGSFCGEWCATNQDCPGGYACKSGVKGTNGSGSQCVKSDGVCACSPLAQLKNLTTACATANASGTCTGSRMCTASGLTACDAAVASTETCNGKDDNCDGVTDEAGATGCSNWFTDSDGDGYGAGASLGCTCAKPAGGYASQGGDCNDAVASIHPGATPFCSGFDANCDGVLDVVPCDDGDPCTLDGCSFVAGSCTHKPMPSCLLACKSDSDPSCNDGNPCTDDSCVAGVCAHAVGLGCACTGSCDDGNVCTDDSCDKATGKCAHAVVPLCCDVSVDTCDDGQPCTLDQFDAATNQCKHICDKQCCNTDSDCDDGNLCTIDQCEGGCSCTHVAVADCCNLNAQCDDGDVRTVDKCDAPINTCTHTPLPVAAMNPLPNACTPALCDDGNPCTTDTCGCAGYCENTAIAGCTLPCDVTACSAFGNCVTKACDATGQCVKSNACNANFCFSSLDCDDGDACTADLCTASGCLFKVLTCDDANPCTLDACLAGGCAHVFVLGCAVASP